MGKILVMLVNLISWGMLVPMNGNSRNIYNVLQWHTLSMTHSFNDTLFQWHSFNDTLFLGIKRMLAFWYGMVAAIMPIPWNVFFPSSVLTLWSTLSPIINIWSAFQLWMPTVPLNNAQLPPNLAVSSYEQQMIDNDGKLERLIRFTMVQ